MTERTELLTAEELADRLRVRPNTVRVWARRGMIPKVQLSPKVIRFDAVAVVAALANRQNKGGSDE